jgi:hypothetical protein
LHVIACVALPAVWGVAMYYVFSAANRRLSAPESSSGPPPIDYSI